MEDAAVGDDEVEMEEQPESEDLEYDISTFNTFSAFAEKDESTDVFNLVRFALQGLPRSEKRDRFLGGVFLEGGMGHP